MHRKPNGVCSVEGCGHVWQQREWCRKHWRRWKLYGDPLGFGDSQTLAPVEVRYWRKVCQTAGCWIWRGGHDGDGYGSFNNGHGALAHRWLWEYLNGSIAAGMELDHLCRRRDCVRPDHLEPVTHAENMARGSVRNRTHCKRGHPQEGANIYPRGTSAYRCRICREAYLRLPRKR